MSSVIRALPWQSLHEYLVKNQGPELVDVTLQNRRKLVISGREERRGMRAGWEREGDLFCVRGVRNICNSRCESALGVRAEDSFANKD